MSQTPSPLAWFGGKARQAPLLLSLLPAHEHWVEVFGGSCVMTFSKPPARIETINDRDEALIGFFRVLRDPELFSRFERLCRLTPYSREEFRVCRRLWKRETDPVVRAWRWFVSARMSYSGAARWSSWGYVVNERECRISTAVSRWLGAIEGLPRVHARLATVQIECADWRAILDRYDGPDTLFFLDPPYLLHKRSGGDRYRHEMTLADHEELVARILELRAMVILCGYRDPAVHAPLEDAGWQRIDALLQLAAAARAGQLRDRRTETIWVNPAAQARRPQQLSLTHERSAS